MSRTRSENLQKDCRHYNMILLKAGTVGEYAEEVLLSRASVSSGRRVPEKVGQRCGGLKLDCCSLHLLTETLIE